MYMCRVVIRVLEILTGVPSFEGWELIPCSHTRKPACAHEIPLVEFPRRPM